MNVMVDGRTYPELSTHHCMFVPVKPLSCSAETPNPYLSWAASGKHPGNPFTNFPEKTQKASILKLRDE